MTRTSFFIGDPPPSYQVDASIVAPSDTRERHGHVFREERQCAVFERGAAMYG